MKEKQVLLTFDYELFLGLNSGTVEQCMILPTDKIHQVLSKHNTKAVFFVDTTYIYRLEEQAIKYKQAENDLIKIKNQLKQLATDGHSLFHHFHPHWLDAIYSPSNNTWDCSNHSRFALSNLEVDQIKSIISYSDIFLRSLYPKDQTPLFFGFRAGGLYSQPFERLVPFFKEKNIKYDFSVLKGAFSDQKNYRFDYMNALNIKEPFYRFENSNTEVHPSGFFMEFSMNNFSMNIFQRIINSIYYRLNSQKDTWKRFGDGNSSGNRIQNSARNLISNETFSIELLNKIKAIFYYLYLKKNNSIHIISHPKLVSEHSMEAFDRLLGVLNKRFTINSKFDTFLS